jgi:hypothetical protein
MKMDKIVIMDIDGVLADFEGRLVQAVSEEFGPNIGELNRHMYSFADRYKQLPDVLNFAMDFTNNRHSYHGLSPIAEGIQFIQELYARNLPVLFCTSRPQSARPFTEAWINREIGYVYPEDLVVHDNKATWIQKHYSPEQVAFVVDDNPDVCKYLTGYRFLCFAWRQPWNESVFPAIIPTRDTFYVVEDGADEGINLLAEIEVIHG